MSDDKEKDEEKPIVPKTAVDLQRLKLMKLMKNVVSICVKAFGSILVIYLLLNQNYINSRFNYIG